MAQKLIVITGITDRQGRSVAETFLKDPQYHVRGITRNPTSASAQALEGRGVEIFRGTFDEPASLISAFHGANVIFATTDFWTIYKDPASQGKVPPGKTLNEWAYEVEIQQGKNIADAAAAVMGSTLELFVYSSLQNTRKFSNYKYKWIYHFDSRAAIADYIAEQQPLLNKKTYLYIPGCFVNNMESFMRPIEQGDGSYLFAIPGSGNRKIPWIDPELDSGASVQALTKVAPGKKVLVYGEMLTFREAAALWGELQNVEVRFQQVELETWIKSLPIPSGFARELGEMYEYLDEFGYLGNDSTITDYTDLEVPIATTPILEALKRIDWSTPISEQS